jgi:hypothetical protein
MGGVWARSAPFCLLKDLCAQVHVRALELKPTSCLIIEVAIWSVSPLSTNIFQKGEKKSILNINNVLRVFFFSEKLDWSKTFSRFCPFKGRKT